MQSVSRLRSCSITEPAGDGGHRRTHGRQLRQQLLFHDRHDHRGVYTGDSQVNMHRVVVYPCASRQLIRFYYCFAECVRNVLHSRPATYYNWLNGREENNDALDGAPTVPAVYAEARNINTQHQ